MGWDVRTNRGITKTPPSAEKVLEFLTKAVEKIELFESRVAQTVQPSKVKGLPVFCRVASAAFEFLNSCRQGSAGPLEPNACLLRVGLSYPRAQRPTTGGTGGPKPRLHEAVGP